MTRLHKARENVPFHPLDIYQDIAEEKNWLFERPQDDELHIHLSGDWFDWDIALEWHPSQSLHCLCAFGVKAPSSKRAEILALLAYVNARLSMGHFDLWQEDGQIIFRAAMPLADVRPTPQICMAFLDASEEARSYALAFQAILWSDLTPEEAVQLALLPTEGHA